MKAIATMPSLFYYSAPVCARNREASEAVTARGRGHRAQCAARFFPPVSKLGESQNKIPADKSAFKV